jgi:tetratricopeptide (TPR) repeat protein
VKNPSQIFDQKVSLIYEYNKTSPLFVRIASNQIEANNPDKAIEILNDGLNRYPEYPVAYFLLGKAYTIKGLYSQALKYVKRGSELIHSPKTYDYYLREIEAIKKQRSFFKAARWEDNLKEEPVPDSRIKEIEDSLKTMPPITESIKKLNEEIMEAKETIQKAKESPAPSAKSFAESNMIVSETLAKIYVNQGEFQEAITVYEKLLKKNPDKKDYYEIKIEEIKIRMNPDQL